MLAHVTYMQYVCIAIMCIAGILIPLTSVFTGRTHTDVDDLIIMYSEWGGKIVKNLKP